MMVTVIGAGLAGSEAAWQLAERGFAVRLCEMKPSKMSPAHHSPDFAELVCSNSLRGDRLENAVGLLKEELRRLGSLILSCAEANRVEAGGALAVDRYGFSGLVTQKIRNHPNITVVEEEITQVPEGPVIIATGPLTSDAMSAAIQAYFGGQKYMSFFEGCMPVEVMARRGEDTLRYGPMKPVGLKDPKTGKEPYAVVQLRKDNALGSVYNLVGFQTHLKFPEQKRVFSMIPALHDAVRYGVMHRNTFLDSPRLLDRYYADRRNPLVAFAGQMTGVEGYVESTASGYLAAVSMAAKLGGAPIPDFPKETAIGALSQYISDTSIGNFQPMNVNFGIMTPLGYKVKGKANKNLAIAERSLAIIDQMVREHNV